jgi:hypothetical protein
MAIIFKHRLIFSYAPRTFLAFIIFFYTIIFAIETLITTTFIQTSMIF